MSFNPEAAFNKVLSLQARSVTLDDLDTDTQATIKAAPSNYFRNMAGPEEVIMEGREFVISKKELDASGFPSLKRGQKFIDADMGASTVTTIREMVVLGNIVGYRIRVE